MRAGWSPVAGRLRSAWRALGCTPVEQVALGVLALSALGVLGIVWWAQRPAIVHGPVPVALASTSAGPSGGLGSPPVGRTPPGGQAPGRVASGAAAAGAVAGGAATESPSIRVHVAGAVRRPGVYDLPPSARVVDALDAAGGMGGSAAADAINLAAPLVDGAQVRVPTPGETAAPVPGSVGTTLGAGVVAPAQDGAPDAPEPVDLNAADQAALETLPGVGPVTAERILAHRDQIGRFDHVDELLEVRGIGAATLEELRDAVVVR